MINLEFWIFNQKKNLKINQYDYKIKLNKIQKSDKIKKTKYKIIIRLDNEVAKLNKVIKFKMKQFFNKSNQKLQLKITNIKNMIKVLKKMKN